MKKLIYLTVLVLFFTQCKKDDEVQPAYVGSWEETFPYDFGTGEVDARQIFVFTKSTWDMSMDGQLMSDTWISVMKMGGTMSVTNEDAVITTTKIGFMDEELNITMINQGETGFDEALVDAEVPATFNAKITVSGNQLTLKADFNKDGVFDSNEITVLTKI